MSFILGNHVKFHKRILEPSDSNKFQVKKHLFLKESTSVQAWLISSFDLLVSTHFFFKSRLNSPPVIGKGSISMSYKEYIIEEDLLGIQTSGYISAIATEGRVFMS